MNYIFVKFFELGLGLDFDCFWSRSQTLVLEICRSRSRSRKNCRAGLDLGLGLNVCGLDYITMIYINFPQKTFPQGISPPSGPVYAALLRSLGLPTYALKY